MYVIGIHGIVENRFNGYFSNGFKIVSLGFLDINEKYFQEMHHMFFIDIGKKFNIKHVPVFKLPVHIYL